MLIFLTNSPLFGDTPLYFLPTISPEAKKGQTPLISLVISLALPLVLTQHCEFILDEIEASH